MPTDNLNEQVEALNGPDRTITVDDLYDAVLAQMPSERQRVVEQLNAGFDTSGCWLPNSTVPTEVPPPVDTVYLDGVTDAAVYRLSAVCQMSSISALRGDPQSGSARDAFRQIIKEVVTGVWRVAQSQARLSQSEVIAAQQEGSDAAAASSAAPAAEPTLSVAEEMARFWAGFQLRGTSTGHWSSSRPNRQSVPDVDAGFRGLAESLPRVLPSPPSASELRLDVRRALEQLRRHDVNWNSERARDLAAAACAAADALSSPQEAPHPVIPDTEEV